MPGGGAADNATTQFVAPSIHRNVYGMWSRGEDTVGDDESAAEDKGNSGCSISVLLYKHS